MKRAASWIAGSMRGLLPGGDFGFDIVHTRLYAGFGKSDVRIVTERDDTGWKPLELLSGWEEYDESVAYRIDTAGVLHIKGTVRYGPLNYPVLQLPAEARPTRNIRKAVPMRSGVGLIDIDTDGYVIPRGEEQEAYDDQGNPTGEIVEVPYLSLETGVIL